MIFLIFIVSKPFKYNIVNFFFRIFPFTLIIFIFIFSFIIIYKIYFEF